MEIDQKPIKSARRTLVNCTLHYYHHMKSKIATNTFMTKILHAKPNLICNFAIFKSFSKFSHKNFIYFFENKVTLQ